MSSKVLTGVNTDLMSSTTLRLVTVSPYDSRAVKTQQYRSPKMSPYESNVVQEDPWAIPNTVC